MGDDAAASGSKAISQIPVGESTGRMQEVEVTFERAAQIWWAYVWRNLLLCALAGFVIGFIIGVVGAVAGFTPLERNVLIWFFALPSAIGISIWVLMRVLKKKFRTFRIVLVQN